MAARWISLSSEPDTANVTVTPSTSANLRYVLTLQQNAQVCTLSNIQNVTFYYETVVTADCL